MSNSRKNSKVQSSLQSQSIIPAANQNHKNLRRHLDAGQNQIQRDGNMNANQMTQNLFEIKKRSIDFFQQKEKQGLHISKGSIISGDTDSIRRSTPKNIATTQSKRGTSGGDSAKNTHDKEFQFSATRGKQESPASTKNKTSLQNNTKTNGFFRRNPEPKQSYQNTDYLSSSNKATLIGNSPQMSPRNIKDLLKIKHGVESIRNKTGTQGQNNQDFIYTLKNYQTNGIVNQQNIKRTPSNEQNIIYKKSTDSSQPQKQKSYGRPASGSQSTKASSIKNSSMKQDNLNQNQLSQEQLIEYIQKLIKNNKKHFDKDQANEELYSNLKIFLQQQFEDKQVPVEDSQQFNNMISDLLRMNYHCIKSNTNQNPGLKVGEKQRANSEKNNASCNSSYSSAQPKNSSIPVQQVKISKPTINLSINNNVQKLMIQPINYSGQNSQSLTKQSQQNKRTSSEDNVNQQQLQQKIITTAQMQLQQQFQNLQQNTGQHRKNLPSLDTERQKLTRSKNRGPSADVPVAIQINYNQQNSQSRETSQSSQKQLKQQNVNGVHISQDNIAFLQSNNLENSTTKVDETILQERDKLIKFIKSYIKKHNELPPTTLDYYKYVKLIGKGAFGKVTLGVHKLTGKYVAIKTIEKSYMKDDFSKRKVFQEVYLLKKIKHSNVIRLLEVFESSKHLLMVMEYAGGGDLLRLIKRKGKLQESDAKFIFKQIVYGLAHIHCRSVIHRDIKLDNILLDCEKGVKICDFGVSKIIKKGQVIQEQCGTPAYLAPEIIIDKGYEGFFVDIWSLGVLLFAMLCGTVPFKAQNLEDLHKLILKGEFQFPCDLSSEAQTIVRGMIQLNPKDRLTIPQILTHSWLKETNDGESDEEEEENDGGEGGTKDNKPQQQKSNDIDLKSIQGNVNYVNVDNLFYHENYQTKLSYTDYCCVTEDFSTENIDEEALKVCENFGFPRQFIIKCLNRGDLNHATACYYLHTNAS